MTNAPLTFDSAVAAFASAVRARDSEGSQRCFETMIAAFQQADEAGLRCGGPELAAVLPEIPPGPRSTAAVLVGACVERGADPSRCAPPVLDGAREALTLALDFAERWKAAGDDALPDPEAAAPQGELAGRFGEDAVVAWWTAGQWEMACVAMLNSAAVRARVPARAERQRLARELYEVTGGDFKCLHYALLVLDDEPLVVLDRASRAGWLMRMHGLGDNFQLHTLLAGVLIGGGHLPGEAPEPDAVAVCRTEPGQITTSGSFNLVAPDGTWVWNEGTPSDIPVVDGARLLVLDPPAYQRGWPAGRFFPGIPGDLVLDRALTAQEAEGWFAHVAPSK